MQNYKDNHPKNLLKVAELQISYNPKHKLSDHPKLTNSNQAYSLLIANWNNKLISYCEEFKIILHNR